MSWVFLVLAIGLEVTGTLSLRAANGIDRPVWLVPTVLGYASSFVLLALVLRSGMPVGVAYGIWAACGVALTAVLGKVIFGDPFTWVMGLGVVLIIAGVVLVEMGSRAH